MHPHGSSFTPSEDRWGERAYNAELRPSTLGEPFADESKVYMEHIARVERVEQMLSPRLSLQQELAIQSLCAVVKALLAGDGLNRPSGQVGVLVSGQTVDGVAFGHGANRGRPDQSAPKRGGSGGPVMLECRRRDSNAHWPGPKPGASANWATSAEELRLLVGSRWGPN